MCSLRRSSQTQYIFDLVRFGRPLIFRLADDDDMEERAGIPKVAPKPKPRAVLKRTGTEEDLGAIGEEFEDANPLVCHMPNSYLMRHTKLLFLL